MAFIIVMRDSRGEAFIGPFESRTEATAAGGHILKHDWEVIELVAFDPDNLPLLPSDFDRMKFELHRP